MMKVMYLKKKSQGRFIQIVTFKQIPEGNEGGSLADITGKRSEREQQGK